MEKDLAVPAATIGLSTAPGGIHDPLAAGHDHGHGHGHGHDYGRADGDEAPTLEGEPL